MKILKPHIIELAKTLSGHWYNVWKQKTPKSIVNTGNPIADGLKGRFLGTFPSSTTILNAYPQSPHLTQWIAEQGWHESQRIKSEAGERGTRIHAATEMLEDGLELIETDYALEEWVKIKAFVDWYKEYNPELIAKEFSVFSPKGKYAGRFDRLYKIGGEVTLLDFKSSSSIHEHFPLQFASYAKAVEEITDLKIIQTACVQLGGKSIKGYRFVIYPEWRDHYKVFENVKATWMYDYFTSKKNTKEPPVLELPSTLQLHKKENDDNISTTQIKAPSSKRRKIN